MLFLFGFQNLLQVCERIPTIGTQLKILSTVKATMLGAQGKLQTKCVLAKILRGEKRLALLLVKERRNLRTIMG
jgi:Vinculin family.